MEAAAKQQCQKILKQWLVDYRQFHDLLASEYQALCQRDYDAIETLLAEKKSLLDKIQRQQQTQQSAAETFKNLAIICNKDKDLQPVWQEFLHTAQQCQVKNEVNAKMVSSLLNANKRLFNLFKGADPDNNIYDARGDRHLVNSGGRSVSV